LLQFGIIFWGSTTTLHKALKMQNRIRVMLGLRQRISCGQKFGKLQILNVIRLNILETVMFVVKNPHNYQTNVSFHSKGTRQITEFIYNQ
jgi:hypothetical protein